MNLEGIVNRIAIALITLLVGRSAAAQAREPVWCQSTSTRAALVWGSVRDSLTRQPLRQEFVELRRTEDNTSGASRGSIATAVTDSLGRFCLFVFRLADREIAPSQYRVGMNRRSPNSLRRAGYRWTQIDVPRGGGVGVDLAMLTPEAQDSIARVLVLERLVEQRAKWRASRPPRYYLGVETICFCNGARGVAIVEGDSLVGVVYATTGEEVLNAELAKGLRTVERLFDRLESEVRAQDATRFDITYDTTYGFPRTWQINGEIHIQDSDIRWNVSRFESAPRNANRVIPPAAKRIP